MQCFVCGEQMRVVKVEPHAVAMQGFEFRTFQCVGCGDVEKRQVFDNSRSVETIVARPPAASEPPATLPPAPVSRVMSILGSLVPAGCS